MTKTIETTVRKVTRSHRSASGNPTKVLWTDAGKFTTKLDAACTFAVSDNWADEPVRLTVELGRVIRVEELGARR